MLLTTRDPRRSPTEGCGLRLRLGLGLGRVSKIAGRRENYGALGATPPTCLSTRSGHRDSPPAWRPPERAFPPTRPTSWTLPGVAIYGDLKVRAGGAPVGLGSSQGHGGSGWGVGCAWGSPLPAVVRVWAPGGAAGTWRRFPARPGAFSFPPLLPHSAPAFGRFLIRLSGSAYLDNQNASKKIRHIS